MNFVIDASVAAKWFVEEEGSDKALVLLDSKAFLFAPDLVLFETANVLTKKVRRGEIARRQMEATGDQLSKSFDRLDPTVPLIAPAVALSFELNHALYDCLYLALANHHGATLVTADKRFLAKCGSSRLAGSVVDVEAAVMTMADLSNNTETTADHSGGRSEDE